VRRAVFLDRDGVLNRSIVRDGVPCAPRSVDEMEIYPEAAAALEKLKNAGYLLICVSNQPDVARGKLDRESVAKMEAKLRASLPLDDALICPHDEKDGCDCRKPRPGMLLRAAERFSIDCTNSWMVGDRWRDVDAGAAAGCRSIYVDREYQERQPVNLPVAKVRSVAEAAEYILAANEMR
jgi:D-glycero-D-manno-heptose 1,7-bisphosphate phosphatase